MANIDLIKFKDFDLRTVNNGTGNISYENSFDGTNGNNFHHDDSDDATFPQEFLVGYRHETKGDGVNEEFKIRLSEVLNSEIIVNDGIEKLRFYFDDASGVLYYNTNGITVDDNFNAEDWIRICEIKNNNTTPQCDLKVTVE